MKKPFVIILLFAILSATGCKKCYFCGGNYNGNICEGNPEYKYISKDSTGEYVYNGVHGKYVCAPQ